MLTLGIVIINQRLKCFTFGALLLSCTDIEVTGHFVNLKNVGLYAEIEYLGV